MGITGLVTGPFMGEGGYDRSKYRFHWAKKVMAQAFPWVKEGMADQGTGPSVEVEWYESSGITAWGSNPSVEEEYMTGWGTGSSEGEEGMQVQETGSFVRGGGYDRLGCSPFCGEERYDRMG